MRTQVWSVRSFLTVLPKTLLFSSTRQTAGRRYKEVFLKPRKAIYTIVLHVHEKPAGNNSV